MLCPYLMQAALTSTKALTAKDVECRAACARRIGDRCADAVKAEALDILAKTADRVEWDFESFELAMENRAGILADKTASALIESVKALRAKNAHN